MNTTPGNDQFAHASGIMVLTPEGKISRYFYDIHYSPRDLRLGLVEASENKIGSPVDQILLFCFHYDPAEGRYGVTIMNLVRAGGVLTMIGVGMLMFRLWRGAPAGGADGVTVRRRFRVASAALNGEGYAMIFADMVWFPSQASTTAQSVDELFFFLLIVCGSVGLARRGLDYLFSVRYRRRTDAPPPPQPRCAAA